MLLTTKQLLLLVCTACYRGMSRGSNDNELRAERANESYRSILEQDKSHRLSLCSWEYLGSTFSPFVLEFPLLRWLRFGPGLQNLKVSAVSSFPFLNLADIKTGEFFVLRLFALEQYLILFVAMHTWRESDLSPGEVQSKL